jgi:molybdopterin-dependent oxidoreductase alpha subunit
MKRVIKKAVGEGPNQGKKPVKINYEHTTAGWDAVFSVGKTILKREEPISALKAIFRMNHENGGFDCPGCAWPDDRKGLRMDICENGIKHSTSEMTRRACNADFFAKHTVSELATWSSYALEDAGRLTDPMVYDAETDHYIPITWENAFKLVGDTLQSLQSPHEATFYTSGRLSNEGTFLYQLLTREFGTNNQPDCSNMCHEASGRALTASLGTGKGTVDLIDWQKADAIFLFGINAASNTPRMLSALTSGVKENNTKIVHVNPLLEAASRKAITPHEMLDMLLLQKTELSALNIQPRIGGDFALLRGLGKYILEMADKNPLAIDRQFIQNHTAHFEQYKACCESESWSNIEEQSGVYKTEIAKMAEVYTNSRSCIFGWCLGLTQHDFSVDAIRELVNILLLRGNIGREGAGPCPIRGHSNVQGNRTLGINHHPDEKWLAKMDAACGIVSPREHGYGTVASIEAMKKGDIKVLIGLGGNFVKALPDPEFTEAAVQNCELTVQISTKLNRSHVIHGKKALILPCLGRTDKDEQASGVQSVTVEDSMAMVHISKGMNTPLSKNMLSELAIVAGIAQAALPNTKTPWQDYVDDYDKIRDKISEAIDGFEDFNRRVRQPLGFRLKQPARELVFLTDTQKANFSTAALPNIILSDGYLRLMTMRSHDQWNTAVYSDNDRYRGIKNIRTVILMNKEDMQEKGVKHLSLIDITSITKEGAKKFLQGYTAIEYDIPKGNAAGYMPELNVLCHIKNYSLQSEQPMFKNIIIEIKPSELAE